MTRFAHSVAMNRFGSHQVRSEAPVLTYSDDFSEFLQVRPGSYVAIGAGENAVPLHHPTYDFDDRLIAPAARFWRDLVIAYLGN